MFRTLVEAGTSRGTGVAGLLRVPSVFAVLLLVAGGSIPLGAQVPADGTGLLRSELARLAAGTDGVVGVGVLHLETGREVYLHGDETFPMASTYKVPIAVQLLSRVDRGEVRLDSLIAVESGHLHPGSGTLTDLFDEPGVLLSVRNLMDLMLQISDNSATDIVLDVAGGGEAVSSRMRELGHDDIRVDRPTVALIGDYVGVADLPPSDEVTPERWDRLTAGLDGDMRDSASSAFDRDPRDTATPRSMTRLLREIWEAEVLSEDSSELLLDVMYGCRTGRNRLKGMLPPGTEVAHKTGTIGGTTNDLGIIDLPHGAGHVAVTVFVRESDDDVRDRERVIAQIARSVHDFFTFTAEAGATTAGGR